MCFHHFAKWLGLLMATLLIFSTASYAADAHITVSAFTTTANKHKPSDMIQQLNNEVKKIYFFTDLRNFQGQTLIHQWSYNGWVAQSIPFEIKGSRWRVSSNKSLKPRGKGTWTVKVLDETGRIIQKNTISYHKKSTHTASSEIKTAEKKQKPETKLETKPVDPKVDKTKQVHKKVSSTTKEKEEKKSKKTEKTSSQKDNNSSNIVTSDKEKIEETAKDDTIERTKKVNIQNNTEKSEVKSSRSSLSKVTVSESAEKKPDDHIGDCDDEEDEAINSTGKQQVRDE